MKTGNDFPAKKGREFRGLSLPAFLGIVYPQPQAGSEADDRDQRTGGNILERRCSLFEDRRIHGVGLAMPKLVSIIGAERSPLNPSVHRCRTLLGCVLCTSLLWPGDARWSQCLKYDALGPSPVISPLLYTPLRTMVALTILAGGFVNFIATYLFDPDAKSLTLVRQTPTGPSPSWIEKYAVNPSFLV